MSFDVFDGKRLYLVNCLEVGLVGCSLVDDIENIRLAGYFSF